MDQISQAEQGYRKAIEIDSNNPLAWKGLADLFTKSNEQDPSKVTAVYKELVRLSQDEKKLLEYYRKLAPLLESTEPSQSVQYYQRILPTVEDKATTIDILKRLVRLLDVVDEEAIRKTIVDQMLIIQKKTKAKEVDREKAKEIEDQLRKDRVTAPSAVKDVLASIMDLAFPNTGDFYMRHIQNLKEQRRLNPSDEIRSEIVERSRKMLKEQPNHVYAYESLLLLDDEDQTVLSPAEKFSILQRIFHISPHRGFGLVGLGICWSLRIAKDSSPLVQLESQLEELGRGPRKEPVSHLIALRRKLVIVVSWC
eukprot:TRINITY_DN951_c0_g1_i3.p1 TRINITY_DN951_c0_g1~~TRINITY_DN951_c0_g1_i3.p1  ORF type:complete len:362 (-),score=115.61 TRINITY_DN951_c0_g1_i3:928-1857(-)